MPVLLWFLLLLLFFFRFLVFFLVSFLYIHVRTRTYMIPCLENKLHETVQCIYLYLRKRRIRLKLDVIIPAWFVISLLLQITVQPPSSDTQESRNFAWDYLDRVYQSVHPTPPIPWYIYIYIFLMKMFLYIWMGIKREETQEFLLA